MSVIMIEIFIQLGFSHILMESGVHIFKHKQLPLLNATVVTSGSGSTVPIITLFIDDHKYCKTLLTVVTFSTIADWLSAGK